jgi:hypothetical protein
MNAGIEAGAETGAEVGTDSSSSSVPDAAFDGPADSSTVDASLCPSNQGICQGKCLDFSNDRNNCGGCGAACLSLQACSDSKCVCATGATLCAGICVDTAISAANCGGCSKSCGPDSVCTEGVCSAATSGWPLFGYDAAHTGDNAAETGVPPAIDSWSTTVALASSALSPATVEKGRAFVSIGGSFRATTPLVAVDVSDGSPLWTYNFGSIDSLGQQAVVDGTVYTQTVGSTENCNLWAIDAATATVKWASSFDSQWAHFWAPLVVGSSIFVNGGEYGGLYGFHVADGSQIFFNSSLGQYDSWSPAYFGGSVYSFVAGTFAAEDPTSGSVVWSTMINWNWTGYSMDTSPVFGPSYACVIAPPNLVAIDPVKRAVAWTANGTFSGTPAVASGVVYGISAGNLIARAATTGALLATFVGDTELKYPPVIANGFVYASSDANVYAWNTTTHALAWTAPVGGWITVAARRLLVAGTDGVLRGFVLSPG